MKLSLRIEETGGWNDNKWLCYVDGSEDHNRIAPRGYGKTPEDAVYDFGLSLEEGDLKRWLKS